MNEEFNAEINKPIDNEIEQLFGDGSKLIAVMVQQALKNTFPRDILENDLIVIDHVHSELHAGKLFFVENFSEYTAGAAKTFLFDVATVPAHSFLQVNGTGEFEVQVLENVTVSGNGSAMAVLNHDRNSTNVSSINAYSSPVNPVTTNSVIIKQVRTGVGKIAEGNTRSENEIILKLNTKYLVTVTNRSNQNAYINTHLNWYEE